MDTETSQTLNKYAQDKYKYGFVTEIESDRPNKGIDEEIIKFISKKKSEPDWMLTWRLDSYKKWEGVAEQAFLVGNCVDPANIMGTTRQANAAVYRIFN